MNSIRPTARRRRPPGGPFGAPATGIEKRAGTLAPINRNRRAVQTLRRRLRDRLTAFLADQAPSLASQIHHALVAHGGATKVAGGEPDTQLYTQPYTEIYTQLYTPLHKEDDGTTIDGAEATDLVDEILHALRFDDWARLVPDVETILVEVLQAGHAAGFAQLAVDALPTMTAQANLDAIAWAHARAAELVGMRWQGHVLVPNPDARWAITESTRTMVRADVVQALEEGWSNETLATALGDAYAFGKDRADTIARTETARADVAGNVESYRASGVVSGKRWLLGSEHEADGVVDECDTAAKMGVVPLDSDFGGIGDPPAHPRCVCDLMPELAEE